MPPASIIDRAIGSRLRAERLERQLDAACFAECVGLTPERLAAFEIGVERIDARAMLAICRQLNVGVGHFFEASLDKLSTVDRPAYPLAAE